mmetsp:Transcript_35185/g.86040  ORF Transcript_35185/g.86040 Transcript_35185/m.86040 type:complete len:292 (+) Transcript_35185:891-1766(+)
MRSGVRGSGCPRGRGGMSGRSGVASATSAVVVVVVVVALVVASSACSTSGAAASLIMSNVKLPLPPSKRLRLSIERRSTTYRAALGMALRTTRFTSALNEFHSAVAKLATASPLTLTPTENVRGLFSTHACTWRSAPAEPRLTFDDEMLKRARRSQKNDWRQSVLVSGANEHCSASAASLSASPVRSRGAVHDGGGGPLHAEPPGKLPRLFTARCTLSTAPVRASRSWILLAAACTALLYSLRRCLAGHDERGVMLTRFGTGERSVRWHTLTGFDHVGHGYGTRMLGNENE